MKKVKNKKGFSYKNIIIIFLIIFLMCFILILPSLLYKFDKYNFIKNVKLSVELYENYVSDIDFSLSRMDITDNKLNINNRFVDGTLMHVNKDEIKVLYVTDGKYCAYGTIDNLIVSDGICNTSSQDKVINNTYVISVDANSSIDYLNQINYNVLSNEKIEIKNPVKNNSNFSGWSIKVTANLYDENGFLTTNMKAVWDDKNENVNRDSNVDEIKDVFDDESYLINEIELVIDPKEGIWNNSNEVKSFILKNNDEFLLANPYKRGYVFLGWDSVTSFSENEILSTKLTALYDKDYNNVNIDLDGGVSSQNTLYKLIDGESLDLIVPKKDGYIFYGWLVNGKETKNNKIVMGNKDINVKALWINTNYNISFELNGGTSSQELPNNLEPYETYVLESPVKTGYTFIGWSISGKEASVSNNILTMGVNDTYVIANWKINTYNITYNLDNGIMDNNPLTYNIESSNFILNNPIKEHYIFTGWTGSNINNLTSNVVVKTGTSGDLVYNANWKPVDFNIYYYLNGGTQKVDAPVSYNIENNVVLPTPIKRGYIFDGWYLDNSYTSDFIENINIGEFGDKYFYAKWLVKQYMLDYELNGGSVSNVNTYNVETESFVLNNPVKSYYNFIGWSTDNNSVLNKNVIIEKGSIGDKKYVANYEPINYAISYEVNGGVINNEVSKYNVETETFDLVVPERTGYIFAGWYESELFDTSVVNSVSKGSFGNKKYYAKWIPIEYSISYNLNDDEVQQDIAVYSYNIETSTFELPTPIKEGYNFEGWYTNSNLTGNIFVEIPLGTIGNLEFYPKWRKFEEQIDILIYDYVTKDGVVDNVQSQFVSGINGIDFKKNSAINNGQGVYITSESVDTENPIYYYRGNVLDNNVIFNNYCWLIVRTTETKGTKLIYNGVPIDGKCNNVGSTSQLTKNRYNVASKSGNSGYSYGSSYDIKKAAISNGHILGSGVDYVDGKYILKDTYIYGSDPDADGFEIFNKYRYSCLSSTSSECTSVTYLYFVRNNSSIEAFGISLSNNISALEMIEESLLNSTNTTNSSMKTYLENWYKKSLLTVDSYIEDTIYCNDRSISTYAGWSTDNRNDSPLYFSAQYRNNVIYKPSLNCVNKNDRFTKDVNLGNGKLLYSVGLLTADEASFGGYSWYNSYRTNTYLDNGLIWWTMTPSMIAAANTYSYVAYSMLDSVSVNSSYGVRPVISLKYGTKIKYGNGTDINPFVIE